MPLGIDSTIRFATGNYTRPLTESELATPSPYNTRLNTGLPPGPIDSPGLASIEAAAHPAKVDYLYYVNKPGTCGKLAFSVNRSAVPAQRRTLQLGPRGGRRQLADHLQGIAMPRLAVLGHPVGHSRSPAMHNAALAALGMASSGAMRRSRSRPTASRQRVRAMPGEGFAGANVTVPHKGAALAVADELSGVAREVGAANTLVFSGGEIRAENTDAEGLLSSLPDPSGRAPGAGARRRRRRRGRRSGPWSARAPRSRSGIAPSCAPATSARNWAVGR